MVEKNAGAASASEPGPRVMSGKVVITLINTKYPALKVKHVQVPVEKPEKPKITNQDHDNMSLMELASIPTKNVQSDRWCANLSTRARAHGWWKVR